MKWTISLLLFFLSHAVHGQIMQQNNTPGGYQWKATKTDSLNIVPHGIDTPAIGSLKYGVPTIGAVFYKTADSTFWVRSSTRWNIISGISIRKEIGLKVSASSPLIGTNTYQNNALIGLPNLFIIHVNNTAENSFENFTFDPVSGTLIRQNPWFEGDVLIIGF